MTLHFTTFPIDELRPPFLSPHFIFGAVAQLEERHNGIVEVVGSIPIGSTIFLNHRLRGGFFVGISPDNDGQFVGGCTAVAD